MLGEERKVHALAIPRRAERIGFTWPNAHWVPFRSMRYVCMGDGGASERAGETLTPYSTSGLLMAEFLQ
jgi:hypothetical protein